MLTFLPEMVQSALRYLNLNDVYEVRLRANLPVFVNYLGKYEYLGRYGLTKQGIDAIVCDKKDIEECVYRAGNCSVYSVEEELKQGFITAKNGFRIGLAGEYVMQGGQLLSIRNITSVCIRIPHAVKSCGSVIYQQCMRDRMRSILIVSPPGYGKTTVLRDLTRIIAETTRKNIVICDERAEIGIERLGETCDIIQYCDKKTAFEVGIRVMRPDIIVTDELSAADYSAITYAVTSGVCVLATAHLRGIDDVPNAFMNIFERFVVLSIEKIGKIQAIYDKTGKERCGG